MQGKVDGGVGKDLEESGTHVCGSCVGFSEAVGRSVSLGDSLCKENCSGRNGGWCACNETAIPDSALVSIHSVLALERSRVCRFGEEWLMLQLDRDLVWPVQA